MKLRISCALYALSLVLLLNTPVWAEVWENIPAYPYGSKIRDQEAMINARPVKTVIYKTDNSPQEIIEFFRQKLVNFGWQPMFERTEFGVTLSSFSKKDKVLTIMIQKIQKENYVTISQNKIKDIELMSRLQTQLQANSSTEPLYPGQGANNVGAVSSQTSEMIKQSPDNQPIDKAKMQELMEKTKEEERIKMLSADAPGEDLDFVPRYPGATRINSSIFKSPKEKAFITYYSLDKKSKITEFYRTQMVDYKWSLENSTDFQDLPSQIAEFTDKFRAETILFKSSYGKCLITIAQDPENVSGVIIGIQYHGK